MLRADWLYPDTKIFASSFLLLLLQMTLELGTSSTLVDALMPSGKFASKFEVGEIGRFTPLDKRWFDSRLTHPNFGFDILWHV
jgi:hypothetical protein